MNVESDNITSNNNTLLDNDNSCDIEIKYSNNNSLLGNSLLDNDIEIKDVSNGDNNNDIEIKDVSNGDNNNDIDIDLSSFYVDRFPSAEYHALRDENDIIIGGEKFIKKNLVEIIPCKYVIDTTDNECYFFEENGYLINGNYAHVRWFMDNRYKHFEFKQRFIIKSNYEKKNYSRFYQELIGIFNAGLIINNVPKQLERFIKAISN